MLELHRDKLSDDDYKPFDEGWDANIEHKHQGYNPWALTNWKYYDWQEGWLAADKERQAETQTAKKNQANNNTPPENSPH